ncbi:Neuronal acetylcholine receptor subunit alpha-6 [Mizuhopecten yessoensis]|uniref:Neuronal acetylcholine receptor subunit alpha-6 n=2 Tax=Mizuhopecten yessoensis TaxID=6573 RepID=A0A210QT72_MIZYE|nr:Neuronal acetylcholine receptor subunit alpha-6 [Mizuhopecten yessoensis]
MMDICIPTLFVMLLSTLATGNNTSVGTQLYRSLLLNYEKNVRPGLDYSYPTMVKCQFKFVGLNRFQEIDSKLSIQGVFIIEWFDERLMWDPYANGNISSTLVPQELLWKPDIAIANAYFGVQFLIKDGVSIRVKYNGALMWVTGDTFVIYCDADVTYYPVDSQTCSINMITWNSYPFEVTFDKVGADTTFERNFSAGNPSWDVKDITMTTTINPGIATTVLSVNIKLKRLPEYIVVNIILPVCFLCIINIFVFVLPAESGERIGFSITLLLSVAVFMTILSDSLPQSSRPQIATLCYFLFSQLMVSILMMIFTIYGLRFYWMMPDKSIPVYLKLFSRIMDRVCLGSQCCKLSKQVTSIKPTTEHIPDSGKQESNFRTVPELEEILPEPDEYLTWQKIANDFDNFCIIFFMTLIVVTNAVFCERLSSQ